MESFCSVPCLTTVFQLTRLEDLSTTLLYCHSRCDHSSSRDIRLSPQDHEELLIPTVPSSPQCLSNSRLKHYTSPGSRTRPPKRFLCTFTIRLLSFSLHSFSLPSQLIALPRPPMTMLLNLLPVEWARGESPCRRTRGESQRRKPRTSIARGSSSSIGCQWGLLSHSSEILAWSSYMLSSTGRTIGGVESPWQ